MAKVVEFRVRGDDPSLAKMKAMLEGVAMQAGDRSMQIGEIKVLAVTTAREDVYELLSKLAKLNLNAPTPKKYNKKPRLDAIVVEEA